MSVSVFFLCTTTTACAITNATFHSIWGKENAAFSKYRDKYQCSPAIFVIGEKYLLECRLIFDKLQHQFKILY